jgi:protein-disulfide isomerase
MEELNSSKEVTLKIKITPVRIYLAGVLSAIIIVALPVGLLAYYRGTKATTGAAAYNPPAVQQPTARQPAQPTGPGVTMEIIRALFDGRHIALGDKNEKLIFVEISDPSCPYCQIAGGKNPSLNKQAGSQFTLSTDGGNYVAPVPEMRKLLERGKAAFVWIYANGHGNGEMGAKALYCANEKGKFWQVNDLLMSATGYDLLNNTIKNDKTKSADLANFLKSAIDYNFMKGCLESGKYDSQLADDMSLAETQFGFGGTPDFFVNTTNFEGAVSFGSMQSAVDAALK